MSLDFTLDAAMTNLLGHCAGLRAGDRLVVVEEAGSDYYDGRIGGAVAAAARARGIDTDLHRVPFCHAVDGLGEPLTTLMSEADCTIFCARLGDQVRFREMPKGIRAVVCYALDLPMLASAFGAADYRAFLGLKHALDDMLFAAGHIRVTCPRGTDFAGPGPGAALHGPDDVSIIRFPMSTFAPVPAQGFSGRVVLAGFLMGTGSRYYEPYGIGTQGRLIAHFREGRLTGFGGSPVDVAMAEAHYTDIAERFGIDRDAVHSWHAGIHPGCAFANPVEADFLRWSGGAFGNPRILHFHTCGTQPPGEISWNVLDPTVEVDGFKVWEDGVLHPDRVPGAASLLAEYPCAAAAFAHPARDVGIMGALLDRIGA
ncbi:hypothetical protein [Thetidibacter halocola]|uniref:Uncharacterized protein n=1 Tax=Thetidibacter halocola TaxID=2827239 RepID=A0A8J7WCS7_9RHOB|nr:hypothetical protein [Thetidibacter halocola]MBS0124079.1 hypothetical protein [Thetidibacter halocola]